MDKAIFIKVTIYETDERRIGRVIEQIVQVYEGSYFWEVEQVFERLGALVANKIDPQSP
jgi:hypothetical protein